MQVHPRTPGATVVGTLRANELHNDAIWSDETPWKHPVDCRECPLPQCNEGLLVPPGGTGIGNEPLPQCDMHEIPLDVSAFEFRVVPPRMLIESRADISEMVAQIPDEARQKLAHGDLVWNPTWQLNTVKGGSHMPKTHLLKREVPKTCDCVQERFMKMTRELGCYLECLLHTMNGRWMRQIRKRQGPAVLRGRRIIARELDL